MRRIRHIAATLLLALGAFTAAWAQTRVVSGTVLDTGQQPLVGAAVLVAGTTTGDVTMTATGSIMSDAPRTR